MPDPADRRKVAYRLTEKGRDLLPVLLSLRQWGERWVSGMPSNPVLVDRYSRQPIAPMAVRAADGRALSLNELDWVDRIGADRQGSLSGSVADSTTDDALTGCSGRRR